MPRSTLIRRCIATKTRIVCCIALQPHRQQTSSLEIYVWSDYVMRTRPQQKELRREQAMVQ
jgi:hypothetical protein